ncbi:Vam7p [Sporobolomyces salmoneus]|uniref:Vam7p n=1 Tax=Sporobolomyces salmoneus TaxID=183962 RepID=UPI00317D6532
MTRSPTQSIQSISVPSYLKISSPTPAHVVYTLSISLPSRSYTIQHRYSSFVLLSQTLTSSCGAPPPNPLPPKHPSSWFNPLTRFGSNNLTEEQLEERREGLERWLRSILSARDPRWRSSKTFQEFLVAPPEKDSSSASSKGETAGLTDDREWTSTGWTEEYKSLEDSTRNLRTKLDERDFQLLSNDSTAHASAKTAKTSLVEIVSRLGALAKGLEWLAKKGKMTDGEIRRRSELLQRMQGDLEELGRKTGNAPRIGAGRRGGGTARAGEEEMENPSVARRALLGSSSSKATTRVLGGGGGGPAQETAETRPLDDQGVMQLQQQYMDDQDSKLESLTAALRRQRHLGEMINQELALQEDVIDQLERGTDRVSGKIKSASKQMKRL